MKQTKTKQKTDHAERVRYFEGLGRRKTAVARVRLMKDEGDHMINGRKLADYFPLDRLRRAALDPLEKMKPASRLRMNVKVSGGGIAAQADAVRHGVSRALVVYDEELKRKLRHLGFLTRDPRMVERKKYGLKKARRAPQWAKR